MPGRGNDKKHAPPSLLVRHPFVQLHTHRPPSLRLSLIIIMIHQPILRQAHPNVACRCPAGYTRQNDVVHNRPLHAIHDVQPASRRVTTRSRRRLNRLSQNAKCSRVEILVQRRSVSQNFSMRCNGSFCKRYQSMQILVARKSKRPCRVSDIPASGVKSVFLATEKTRHTYGSSPCSAPSCGQPPSLLACRPLGQIYS